MSTKLSQLSNLTKIFNAFPRTPESSLAQIWCSFPGLGLQTKVAGRGVENGEFPKVPRRGCKFRKRGGVQKSMGHKAPLKTGLLIYLPVTSRPLIYQQKEAVLSPCSFATTHLTACVLNYYLPFEITTHETEDPFATAQQRPFGPRGPKTSCTRAKQVLVVQESVGRPFYGASASSA